MLSEGSGYVWWRPLVGTSEGVMLLLLFVACLGVLVVLLRGSYRLHHRKVRGEMDVEQAKKEKSTDGERATITIEFVMVLPVLLFIVLLLVQVMQLMVGNLFVHYAAYNATRCAVTYLPVDAREAGGGDRNWMMLNQEFRRPKYDAIKRAAAMSLVSVSGKWTEDMATVGVDVDGFVAGLKEHYELLGRPVPVWVERMAGERLRYAAANTRIEMLEMVSMDEEGRVFELVEDDFYQAGVREAVTVRVVHRLNLSVPYVRGLFADGRFEEEGAVGAYALVQAHVSLTNEGIDPALPERPSIQRRNYWGRDWDYGRYYP
ncbi:TadE/TadG family type IV pilus assembly protein [Poriferisphaera sp. WC338]|uniref:TadE/TadG family type IV pilus assembly protein n=1 Tax=Poriferisphaera sp. WC338 TaxID=3425129 RepID=UPI003D81966F